MSHAQLRLLQFLPHPSIAALHACDGGGDRSLNLADKETAGIAAGKNCNNILTRTPVSGEVLY
jgi:hypothetical protein